MSFQVGETITPVVDVIISGATLPTTTQSGVITQRALSYSQDGIDYYDYYLLFSPPVSGVTEGGLEVIASNIWFTSGEVGLEIDFPLPVDFDSVNSNINSSKSTSFLATSTVNSLLNQFSPSDSLYDTLSKVGQAVTENNDQIQSLSIIGGTLEEQIESAAGADLTAALKGSDQLLFQETAQDLAELQEVINEEQAEQNARVLQTDQQQEAERASIQQEEEDYYRLITNSTSVPVIDVSDDILEDFTPSGRSEEEQQEFNDLINQFLS